MFHSDPRKFGYAFNVIHVSYLTGFIKHPIDVDLINRVNIMHVSYLTGFNTTSYGCRFIK